jgi:5'-methylthioadenosine phosphorylase
MKAEIGIIGGSGFYSLLEDYESIQLDTEYGKPSAEIALGRIGGKTVAFIPRHGKNHTIPPHKVPYRANIAALADLGVKRIIATASVGSLKEEYAPGEFVLFDQFVNMTHGRQDTFYDKDVVAHVSMADPYCSEMRSIASKLLKGMKIKYHEKGTAVVINGPRFSSRAESKFFGSQGFETINMTQYPEAALAREKALCYLGIGIITDYDSGLEGRKDIKSVTTAEMLRVFGENVGRAKKIVSELVPMIGNERKNCICPKSLEGAIVTH